MSDEVVVSQEELDRLKREAHELGLHYSGDDPIELEAHINMARSARGRDHEVPCYGLSYDPTDRRCRICQLRAPCADLDGKPRVEINDPTQMQPVPCEACARGELSVELLTKDTRELRDFGCSTAGCQNTIGIQCGFESVGAQIAREIVLGESDDDADVDADVAETDNPPEVIDAVAEPVPDKPKPKPKLVALPGGKKASKAKPKPNIKVAVRGKAAKKVAARPSKKAAKKKAASKKAPVAKAAPKAVAPPKTSNGKAKLRFKYREEEFKSLSAVAFHITDSRAWSGSRFFGCKSADLSEGDQLQREWQDEEHIVEVIA